MPNEISANYKRVKGIEDKISIASAYTYWIPASERRVVVAARVTPQPSPAPTPAPAIPTTPATTPTPVTPAPTPKREEAPKPPPTITPEKLLEAAASKETTATAVAPPPPPPVTPPKPSVITRPEPIKKVMPKYPEAARAIGAAGKVVVKVVVGVDGKVKSASIYSTFGNPACEEAALAAARQWEFKPATKDGEPFEQTIQIPFDFKP
ncbi:MAG: TonB family protein [candidate division WOR-3 bacterium]|nr:TonB family protein [candidate division WOR-3 bacterium]